MAAGSAKAYHIPWHVLEWGGGSDSPGGLPEPPDVNQYCDRDLTSAEEVPTFPATDFEQWQRVSDTEQEHQDMWGEKERVRVLVWTGPQPVDRMELWVGRHDWFGVVETAADGTHLCTSNIQCHPGVTCNTFTWGNSDGSTHDVPVIPDNMTASQAIDVLVGSACDYISHQIH
eukprot:m.31569 g.31569  ORF g.31569 m.31569 type:complete len:173 (-) comp12504_c1_seq1:79-597(-)